MEAEGVLRDADEVEVVDEKALTKAGEALLEAASVMARRVMLMFDILLFLLLLIIVSKVK
jgi:hypothetical protein